MRRFPFFGMLLALPPLAGGAAEEVHSLQDFCRNIVAHVPDSDVSYRPGVDVHGRAVAPADLPSAGGVTLPEVVEIPLDIPLGQILGDKTPAWASGVDAKLGVVTVNTRTGEVLYNGQPVQGVAQADLIAACRQAGER